jgi:hypothetical protein
MTPYAAPIDHLPVLKLLFKRCQEEHLYNTGRVDLFLTAEVRPDDVCRIVKIDQGYGDVGRFEPLIRKSF